FGSYHYLNQTINGDINNIVAMFNEEQNGIAYPLRFLGQMSNPLLPFYILTSPLKNNFYYPNQTRLTAQQRQNITHFDALMQQAVTPVFQQFQALGYTSLPYYSSTNQSTNQPVFTADQQSNIQQIEDNIGGSDENPFTQAGLPCATFVGNSTYYDQNPPPPKWSYPFDQPQDTIQMMNTFASGNAQKSEALTLALAIPGMFTTWMLNQPDILGSITPPVRMKDVPVVAISDIGQTIVNKNLAVSAQPLPSSNTSSTWTYSWNFGDGTTASGISANHTYTKTGTYTLSMTASAATGSRTVFKTISVVNKSTPFNNLFAQYPSNGVPPVNHAITLPVPSNNPSVQAPATTPTTNAQPDASPGTSNTFRDLIIGILVVALLALITIIGITRRTRQV
ncbi:MAG TPA: PKD domain-containing protein, partial [Ktedonobacteraceae bacterium]|nr:PKD domain-containing protein [Ktedonobacteraceae bacterium]